jgi:prephenate dehydrogenase
MDPTYGPLTDVFRAAGILVTNRQMKQQHVVIVGAMGNLGRLFADTVRHADTVTTGLDVVANSPDSSYTVFLRSDITSPTPETTAVLASADCVIVCLPEPVALQALQFITAAIPAGSLWIDTLPVKQQICAALASAPHIEALSINPLFGPDLGFRNQNVAAVLVSGGPRATWFLRLLESAGARVTTLTASEHDRLTASIQVATHAALLLFGMTLEKLNPAGAASVSVSTPPHRLLLSLLGRIASAHPHVYWSIQRDHPNGQQVRAALSRAATELEEMVANDDERRFTACLASLRAYLQVANIELEAIARSAVNVASTSTAR